MSAPYEKQNLIVSAEELSKNIYDNPPIITYFLLISQYNIGSEGY